MKKLFSGALICFLIVLSVGGCANDKTFIINNKQVEIKTYGWIDSESLKDERVIYQVNPGNIIWSILLSETIIAPVLLTGYYLFEPVGLKSDKQK